MLDPPTPLPRAERGPQTPWGVVPTHVPQNDWHVALIILRHICRGKKPVWARWGSMQLEDRGEKWLHGSCRNGATHRHKPDHAQHNM